MTKMKRCQRRPEALHTIHPSETEDAPIQTNPEEDVIQIHTDGEVSGENFEHNTRLSNQKANKPNRYGSLPYTGNFWG